MTRFKKHLIVRAMEFLVFLLLLWLVLPAGFVTSRYFLSHDTISYTNEPGLSKGFSLSNFAADGMRTPGYPLFLAFASFGRLPRPNAIAEKPCGTDILNSGDCASVAANFGRPVTVILAPFVYGFSQTTDLDLQRAIVLGRVLFIAALAILFLCLEGRFGFGLACVCVLAIAHFMRLGEVSFLDFAATESLFPALLIFYIAAMLTYVTGRARWLIVATALAIYIALVRPAFIYLPILHFAAAAVLAIPRRQWVALISAASLIVLAFVWLFVWSPVQFFSVANYQSDLLRTAVISDQSTVKCLSDPAEKTLLASYLDSIAGQTTATLKSGRAQYWVQRYFDLGIANSYRLWDHSHPIYREPRLAQVLQAGEIPQALIDHTLRDAGICNWQKNLLYAAVNVAMMVGITPQLTREAPRYFFRDPAVFWVSATMILVSLVVALRRRESWWGYLIALPAAIYAGTILIVAFKQGGEARYSYVVEPLFVLSAAGALAYLIGELRSRWRC